MDRSLPFYLNLYLNPQVMIDGRGHCNFSVVKPFIAMQPKLDFFIGVDASKETLDFAVTNREVLLFHRLIANSAADIRAFFTELR